MVENIEKVLDRGEHLELLVKKSEDLHDTTYDFKQKSITLRNQMFWQVDDSFENGFCPGLTISFV